MIYKIFSDGEILYSSNYNDPELQLTGITLDVEIGKTGWLNFTIPPTHPLYSKLKNQLSILILEQDGEQLFRGRLFDTTSNFSNQKQCKGEGDLNFLADSCVPKIKVKESIKKLLTRYVNEHNSRVEDYKKFTVGNVTIDNADSEEVDVDSNSYRHTSDAIQEDLIDSYGGYLRTRAVGNTVYLDYLKDYNSTAVQTIKFGVNLIDLSNTISPEDIFTILIPIGDNGLTISSVNNGKDYIEVDGAVSAWGKRYKIQNFNGISDAGTLLKEAKLYIKNHYDGSPQTLTLTAVDMRLLGVNETSIHVGDKVHVISIPHNIDKNYTCTSISYDISNPGRTQYVLGKPKQDFTKKYNQKNRDTDSSIDNVRGSAGQAGAAADAVDKKLEDYYLETTNSIQLVSKNINLLATSTSNKFGQVEINMDAVNGRLDLTASKEDLDEQINTVSINLDAANKRIDINAQDIVEINSDLTKINGDLTVLGKTITDEIESMKGDISWLNTKHISCTGITSTYGSFSESLAVTGNTTISGTAFVDSLSLGGSPVRKTTLPVVTAFTQASGQTAPTTDYTLLTTSVANGVAHQPSAGSTVNF